MAKNKRKAGRPSIVNWNKFQLQWKHKTNSEIAAAAGCSQVNVFLKRKRLIAAAEKAGKDASLYICSKKKWTRGKHIVPRTKPVEVPKNDSEGAAVPAENAG